MSAENKAEMLDDLSDLDYRGKHQKFSESLANLQKKIP
jgi:hypothetical protein